MINGFAFSDFGNAMKVVFYSRAVSKLYCQINNFPPVFKMTQEPQGRPPMGSFVTKNST